MAHLPASYRDGLLRPNVVVNMTEQQVLMQQVYPVVTSNPASVVAPPVDVDATPESSQSGSSKDKCKRKPPMMWIDAGNLESPAYKEQNHYCIKEMLNNKADFFRHGKVSFLL